MKWLITAVGFVLLLVSPMFAGEHSALARVTVYWHGEGSGANRAIDRFETRSCSREYLGLFFSGRKRKGFDMTIIKIRPHRYKAAVVYVPEKRCPTCVLGRDTRRLFVIENFPPSLP